MYFILKYKVFLDLGQDFKDDLEMFLHTKLPDRIAYVIISVGQSWGVYWSAENNIILFPHYL